MRGPDVNLRAAVALLSLTERKKDFLSLCSGVRKLHARPAASAGPACSRDGKPEGLQQLKRGSFSSAGQVSKICKHLAAVRKSDSSANRIAPSRNHRALVYASVAADRPSAARTSISSSDCKAEFKCLSPSSRTHLPASIAPSATLHKARQRHLAGPAFRDRISSRDAGHGAARPAGRNLRVCSVVVRRQRRGWQHRPGS